MHKPRIRKYLRTLVFKMLPKKVRHHFYRKLIKLDFNPDPCLTFRIASSKEDLESAFGLLHEAYVQSGYMDPHPSGLRVTKWHALPSTTTLIALWDQEVVGTVSLFRRSAFGVPLEKVFDLSGHVPPGARVTEISALAIRPDFSGKKGQILFPLCKFLFHYSREYFGTTHFAIAVVPGWFEFYEALLRFRPLAGGVPQKYAAAKGVEAIGGILDLESVAEEGQKIYRNAPPERSFYRYMYETRFANFHFPKRRVHKISDPVLSPALLGYFFRSRTSVFSELTETEVRSLHAIYQDEAYRAELPSLQLSPANPPWKSSSIRFDVGCFATLWDQNGESWAVSLVDVSRSGLKMVSPRPIPESQSYRLSLKAGKNLTIELRIQSIWTDQWSQKVGFQVSDAPAAWSSFLAQLEADLFRSAA